jgi:predicted Holliday junction resolvase-like endonuclease
MSDVYEHARSESAQQVQVILKRVVEQLVPMYTQKPEKLPYAPEAVAELGKLYAFMPAVAAGP